MREVLALMAGLAALAVFPATVDAATASDAKAKRARCPTRASPKQLCPRAADVIRTRSDGTIGRSDALQAFAAKIRPLPGVKPPKGGYPFIESGSGPIRWVLGYWSKLTPGQRAAVQKALPGIAVPGGRSPARASAPPRARLAKFTVAEVQQIGVEARDRLNTRFNPDLTAEFVVQFGPGADTAHEYPGVDGKCHIVITPIGQKQDLREMRQTMLHELTHCYFDQLSPVPNAPGWLVEGSAAWVEAVLGREWNGAKYVSPLIRDMWKIYFKDFKTPLTAQVYSAMPFYAHLAQSGTDVFGDLAAAYASPDPVKQAYDIFVDASAQGAAFKTTTAPGGTRLADLGDDWVTVGPMLPGADEARYDPPSVAVGLSTTVVTAKGYGHAVVGLDPSSAAEVVTLNLDTPQSAWGLLHRQGGDDRLQESNGRSYCARDTCVCPNGSKIQPLGDQSYLALYGQKATAKVTLKPVKLKDACQAKTAVTVTGASNMSFTQAFCVTPVPGRLTVELPWTVGNVKMGHVTLEINAYTGKGTYQTPPSLATVYDYRPLTTNTWNAAQSGTITVDVPAQASGYGAAGTVNTTSFREEPYSVVLVAGEWSC